MPSSALLIAAAVPLALVIDRWLGEPPSRLHPVVWIGSYLNLTGGWFAPRRSAQQPDWKRFWLGAMLWLAGASVMVGCAVLLQQWALQLHPLAALLLLGAALKPLLAWRMLRQEVLAVEAALTLSLAQGRAQLARLVSRDVQHLSETEVRESAIESLAENLNDSVVAPLLWFALLGLPGAVLYRFANTADAMWGYSGMYQGRDWTWAGKWAARADDVLSWLPARLTAWLLITVGGTAARSVRRRLSDEASRTVSPNSGWPMAAMALLLGVRLSKPSVYVLNAMGGAPQPCDPARAVLLARKAVGAAAAGACVVSIALRAWPWQALQ